MEYTDEVFLEDRIENKLNTRNKSGVSTEKKRKSALKIAEEEHRKFIKRKIIEKKEKALFGQKEPNLLTWAARVQIKHLNKTDPDYWTPDMLAASFPVSKDVIIKILKSSKIPYDQTEIYKHDQRVHKNWLKLNDALKKLRKGIPIDPEYRLLLENGKLCLMKNAAGSKGFPMPDTSCLYQTQVAIAEWRKPKVRGEFQAILEDYKKDKEEVKKTPENIQVEIEDPTYLPLLETISEAEFSNVTDESSVSQTEHDIIEEEFHEYKTDNKFTGRGTLDTGSGNSSRDIHRKGDSANAYTMKNRQNTAHAPQRRQFANSMYNSFKR